MYGGERNGYRGETSAANLGGTVKINKNLVKPNLGANKFSALASSNLIDNLESVSTMVQEVVKGSTVKIGKPSNIGKVKEDDGSLLAFAGTGVRKNLKEKNQVDTNMSEQNNNEMEKCVLNSVVDFESDLEEDVESDLGDTARFMADEAMTEPGRDQNMATGGDSDSSREHEQFALEQLFGEKVPEVGKEGSHNIVSQ